MNQSLWSIWKFLLLLFFGTNFLPFLQLFELFWLHSLYLRIVHETNWYAIEKENEGSTKGSPHWEQFTISEFKAYIGIWLYMGMRWQPNIKSYWTREGSIFHIPRIFNIITHKYFMALNRCLYITNPLQYIRDKGLPSYNKLE